MQRKYFIFILILYIAIIVSGGIVEVLTEFMIPPSVVEMEKAAKGSLLILIIAPLVLLSGIIGLIGMFCFWEPAIYIFTTAIIAKIVLNPTLGEWKAMTRWDQVFSELEILLDGIIITFIFFGPARKLFIRKRTPNKSIQRAELST